jgi:hypothetical protein
MCAGKILSLCDILQAITIYVLAVKRSTRAGVAAEEIEVRDFIPVIVEMARVFREEQVRCLG